MKLLINITIVIFLFFVLPEYCFYKTDSDNTNYIFNDIKKIEYDSIDNQFSSISYIYDNKQIGTDFDNVDSILNDIRKVEHDSINNQFSRISYIYDNKQIGTDFDNVDSILNDIRKVEHDSIDNQFDSILYLYDNKQIGTDSIFTHPLKILNMDTTNVTSLDTVMQEKQKLGPKSFPKGNIKIIVNNKKKNRTSPGKIITFPIKIINKSNYKATYINNVKLPNNWRILSKAKKIIFNKQSETLELVSVFIPGATLAGKYNIEYSLINKYNPNEKKNIVNIPVVVLPVIDLSVNPMNIRYTSVIAGEPYKVDFIVSNKSNKLNKIKILLQSDLGYNVNPKIQEINFQPNEKKIIQAIVKTEKDIEKKIFDNTIINCNIIGKPNVRATANYKVQIIPRTHGAGEKFVKIPIRLKNTYVSKYEDKYEHGLLTELSGNFTIGENRTNVNFIFMKPNIAGGSIIKQQGRYYVSIKSNNFYLNLGDRNYSLSPLTSTSLYGTGIESSFKFGKFELGSWYYHKNKYNNQDSNIKRYASYLKYHFHGNENIGVNYFKNEQYGRNGNIISFNTHLNPFNKKTFVNMEYAINNQDSSYQDAYLFESRGFYDRWNYSFKFIQSDPLFRGYNNDKEYLSGNINLKISNNWRIFASLHSGKYNSEFSVDEMHSYLSDYYNVGFKFLKSKFRAGINYNYFEREDRTLGSEYHQVENRVNFIFSQQFKKFNYNIFTNHGIGENLLSGVESSFNRYELRFGYKHSSKQSYNFNISYNGYDYRSGALIKKYVNAGLNVRYKLFKNLKGEAYYNMFHYLNDINSGYNSFNVRLTQKLFNGYVSLQTKHYLYNDPEQSTIHEMFLEYSLPINAPIWKKKNVGQVYGNIINAETGEPYKDIIVNIVDLFSVTNEKGEYRFKYLEAGKHILNINASKLDANLIPLNQGPLIINVSSGEKKRLDIQLTKTKTFIGKVAVYKEKEVGLLTKSQKKEYVFDYGLENAIVELRKEDRKEQVISGLQGNFRFSELIPGKWKLSVLEEDIPEGYFVKKDNYEIYIKPNEKTKSFEIKILPKRRKIHMMEEGGEVK
ncbi:MAG: hypothetical protein U9R41_07035 [Candidatus Marinimicrobia bacterium]|nr:hypothetical protein [Candidatus Neomarinimicrobiota bacterium]